MSRLGIFKAKPAPAPIITSAPPLTAEQKKEANNASYWDTVEANTDEERLWGLENFGNTCYCNSVLQALYNCEPFKQFVESYPSVPPPTTALGPPPGEANFPKKDDPPSSPLATKRDNPFDSPASSSPARGWKLGRRQSSIAQEKPATPAVEKAPERRVPLANYPVMPLPNENLPPPSVFETIQTLFHHLNLSPPHQPLPSRKDPKKEQEQVQTASVLAPVPNASTPSSPTEKSSDIPQGPPLLASLPPPSAPRGGGPFQAGSLGRGVVRPEDVLKTIKRENEMFRGMAQQDAHEFLGWVLNKVSEEVEQVDKHLKGTRGRTFVQNLFEGCLTNETRCLSCETTSSRDELFLDLSIDIEQHTSVSACLRGFSASEMLYSKNKFFCESCAGLQEAEKRMKIKRLPNILALHLKRFKYQESLGRYTKLFYRVPFPLELRLPNTSDDAENPDRLYELFAVVVHIGNGPHHGHYVCIVKSAGRWIMCDDENIEPIDESDIFRYFGDYPSGAGYVLFYQAADLDVETLGLKGAKRSGRSNKKGGAPPKTPPGMFGNVPTGTPVGVNGINGGGSANGNAHGVNGSAAASANGHPAPATASAPTGSALPAIEQSPPASPPVLAEEISPRTRAEPTVAGALPVPASAPPITTSFSQAQTQKTQGQPPAARSSMPPRSDSSAGAGLVQSQAQPQPSSVSATPTPMTASSTGTSYTTGTAGTLGTANTTASAGEREKEKKEKWYSLGSGSKDKDKDSSRSRENSESFGRKPSFSMGRQPSVSRSSNAASTPPHPASSGQAALGAGAGTGAGAARERQASGGSYNGGGGLGRRLSGIGGKGLMQRSGSLMKLGLGSKKKDGDIKEQ